MELRDTAAGCVGAVCCTTFGIPFDVAKARLQTGSAGSSLAGCMGSIARCETPCPSDARAVHSGTDCHPPPVPIASCSPQPHLHRWRPPNHSPPYPTSRPYPSSLPLFLTPLPYPASLPLFLARLPYPASLPRFLAPLPCPSSSACFPPLLLCLLLILFLAFLAPPPPTPPPLHKGRRECSPSTEDSAQRSLRHSLRMRWASQ